MFVEKLNEDQLNSQVEKYKRADGQYVYEGTFMNREEVYGVIKEKAIIITLSAHFALDAQEGSIIKIVLFPKQED